MDKTAAILAEIEADEGGAVEVVAVCGMGARPKPRNIIPWYGGTARLAAPTARMVEAIGRDCWVEAFGGAAGVTMQLSPRKLEIYNDLNDGLCNLFMVVRDPRQRAQLLKLLRFTPYSETEWRMCYRGWRSETDPIEKARMFYVAIRQAFVATINGSTWRRGDLSRLEKENTASRFFNSFSNIAVVGRRMQSVQITNRAALDIVQAYDNKNSTVFIDPPYLAETRQGMGQYDHEMTVADHAALLDYITLPSTKAAIIVKHYPAPLYSAMLEGHGWTRLDFAATASSALQSSRNGLKGADPKKFKRVECLWLNPAAQRNQQPTLWQEAAS